MICVLGVGVVRESRTGVLPYVVFCFLAISRLAKSLRIVT